MKTISDLKNMLASIDNRGYKAYKRIQGVYKFKKFDLFIDYVQSDPYAAPSKIRVRVPQNIAKIPSNYYETRIRKVALCDYLARIVFKKIREISGSKEGSGKSGIVHIDRGGQEVLQRSSIEINSEFVEARLSAGLPAEGRRILEKQAFYMLCKEIPKIIFGSLLFVSLDERHMRNHIATVEDAEYIRENLYLRGLVAFIKNGSILPRRSGIDSRPLKEKVTPFKSPESLEVEFFVPNEGRIVGMGIPRGVTLIVGGGYHGKSTLLNAVQFGIYNHKPGDGREYVVSVEGTIKIRAEDGRRIEQVDISGFINNLPSDIDAKNFSTQNASGSTSQAANIIESLEIGAKLLLIDEDTSATNFMIRDFRMQKLVPFEKEPITPFIDRVKELYDKFGVSAILVMGGSGDYFDVSDHVIMMDSYLPYDVTDKVENIVKSQKSRRVKENAGSFKIKERKIDPNSIDPYKRGKIKIKSIGLDKIQFGQSMIDLSSLEQIVDVGQTRLIGDCLYYLAKNYLNCKVSLSEAVEMLYKQLITEGLDSIAGEKRKYVNNYALTRKFEIALALNRLRTLKVI